MTFHVINVVRSKAVLIDARNELKCLQLNTADSDQGTDNH